MLTVTLKYCECHICAKEKQQPVCLIEFVIWLKSKAWWLAIGITAICSSLPNLPPFPTTSLSWMWSIHRSNRLTTFGTFRCRYYRSLAFFSFCCSRFSSHPGVRHSRRRLAQLLEAGEDHSLQDGVTLPPRRHFRHEQQSYHGDSNQHTHTLAHAHTLL